MKHCQMLSPLTQFYLINLQETKLGKNISDREKKENHRNSIMDRKQKSFHVKRTSLLASLFIEHTVNAFFAKITIDFEKYPSLLSDN